MKRPESTCEWKLEKVYLTYNTDIFIHLLQLSSCGISKYISKYTYIEVCHYWILKFTYRPNAFKRKNCPAPYEWHCTTGQPHRTVNPKLVGAFCLDPIENKPIFHGFLSIANCKQTRKMAAKAPSEELEKLTGKSHPLSKTFFSNWLYSQSRTELRTELQTELRKVRQMVMLLSSRAKNPMMRRMEMPQMQQRQLPRRRRTRRESPERRRRPSLPRPTLRVSWYLNSFPTIATPRAKRSSIRMTTVTVPLARRSVI